MKKMTMRALPALLLAVFSGAAPAAGFQALEQNASGLGTGYAGSAAIADNASTIYYNPAGMTLLPGRQISLGVAGVGSRYESSQGGGDAGGWVALPNAYLSWQLSPDLFVGLGVSQPFRLETEYTNGWVNADYAIRSDIKTVNYNPSIAYRLNDKVSLGFGLNYQTLDATLTDITGRFAADDSAWGWNAGALFTLSPAMRVGIAYRSGIDYRLEGATAADMKLPDTLTLSVWQQVSDRWEAMGDLSFTRWNRLDTLAGENLGFRNAWRLAWGAAYKYSDAWKVKFGLAYERTPVHDGIANLRVPDNDRFRLSLGGQWNGGNYGRVDVGYSYLFVRDPSVDASVGGGKYDIGAHVLGAQYSVGF